MSTMCMLQENVLAVPAARPVAPRRSFRRLGALIACLFLALPAAAHAQSADDVFKIGVLGDLSSAYSDLSGVGSVTAVQMAVDDFGGKILGKPIRVVSADHQLKPDVGAAIVSEWYDRENVHAIFDITGSSVALAVSNVVKARPARMAVWGASLSSELVGKACLPNAFKWAPDPNSLAYPLVREMTKKGDKNWFIMMVDSAVSPPTRAAAAKGVEEGGGKIVGEIRYPANVGDVSSFLLQAQAAGAQVLGVVGGGADLFNFQKTAKEFGLLQSGLKIVSFSMYSTDVDSMGQGETQGMLLATPFFPTMSPEAEAWAKRFKEKVGRMPAFSHANHYAAALHYLEAVKQAGTDDARVIAPILRKASVNDFMTVNGRIRGDGQLIRPMYIVKVKAPGESKFLGDYFERLATVSGEEAFLPQSPDCSLGSQ